MDSFPVPRSGSGWKSATAPSGAGRRAEPAGRSTRYARLFPETCEAWDEGALRALAAAIVAPERALWPDEFDGPIPAGYTYLGQFIAHDLSFESDQSLRAPGCPHAGVARNLRRPGLNLDSLYGGGPDSADRHLYAGDGVRFRMQHRSNRGRALCDFERRQDGVALIGDPRNDSTITLAQLHLALMAFHNRVADHLDRTRGRKAGFASVRRMVVEHVQAVVLHDFLWRLMPERAFVRLLRDGPALIARKDAGCVPVEFSHGAFRFGHAMVRGGYHWGSGIGRPDLSQLFDRTGRNGTIASDPLRLDWFVDWEHFFDCAHLPGARRTMAINRARRIRPAIEPALAQVPHGECAEGQPRDLALRDLVRGAAAGIAPAQEIIAVCNARGAFVSALSPDEVLRVCDDPVRQVVEAQGFHVRTPLWFYVLVEAWFTARGERLGPLGAQIVGDTIHAAIGAADHSILKRKIWKPRLPSARPDVFTMPDLLRFAGLV